MWDSSSGFVVNDNSDVAIATAAEAGRQGDDINTTQIVTTILVVFLYLLRIAITRSFGQTNEFSTVRLYT